MALSGVALPSSLAEAKIASLPSTAYYVPNFISADEERAILDRVCSVAAVGAYYADFRR